MTFSVLSSMLALSLLGSFSPQEAQAIFEQANLAFAAQNHVQAKEGYQKLLDENLVGAELHYNLGTTCLELKELGCAIWNLEKASHLSPNAKDIHFNLALARSEQLDSVPSVETPFFYRALRNTSHTFLTWALLGCAWALLLCFVCRQISLKPTRLFQATDFILWVSFALCAFTFAAKWYTPSQWEEGIVLPAKASALQLPTAQAQQLFELHAGLKVRILERTGQFAKIRTANGQEAWINLQSLGML
ncbi:MAG: SH3 domain-containing protein [Cystobacterineae bacterium]|nr:SH3 domain-containing protein [Cystobacterineae bacterium]